MTEDPPPHEQLAATDLNWQGSPTFHLRVAENLDEPSRAIWTAATSEVLDLLAGQEISMDAGIPSDQPDHLEILLTLHEAGPALARVLSGLSSAGYGSFVVHAPAGVAPGGVIIIRVDRNKLEPVEMVSGEHLRQHIGRLVAFHRGRWYELLDVGPAPDGEIVVTVPSPRFNVLQQPVPPGSTTTLTVFDDEYPVIDAPTEPAAREKLIQNGHHLVRSADGLSIGIKAYLAALEDGDHR